jgi:hypothetical protein
VIIWVAAVVTALLVFVIAAVTVGREAHRLDAVAPAPTLDLFDAVDWIAEQLPAEISAEITYEDVRDIVTWHLDEMQQRGVEPTMGADGALVIVDEERSVEALALRAVQEGRQVDARHIRAVLDGELAYFEAIGAIGPLAEAPGEPGAEGDRKRLS